MLVRIPGCLTVGDAFRLRQVLLQVTEDCDMSVHGKRVEVALEPDEERRHLLTVFSPGPKQCSWDYRRQMVLNLFLRYQRFRVFIRDFTCLFSY